MRLFVFLLALLLCACDGAAPATVRLVFATAGQSNMVGQDDEANLPDGFPVNADRLHKWTGDSWVPATEPLQGVGVGPAVAFADAVASAMPGVEVGLVPYAISGTAIASWQPGAGSLQFETLRDETREARAGHKLAGLFWMQGQSDTASLELAEAHAARTAIFFGALRSAWDAPDLPIAFGQLSEKNRSGISQAVWDVVRAGQAGMQSPTQVMVTEPNDDASYMGDAHLNAAAQLSLGRRMAQALGDLI